MEERDGPERSGAEESSSSPGVELSLDAARERLRERGYLERGVEGAVLKGALAARTRTRAFLLGAATGAAFLAAAVAFAQTVLHAVSSALPVRDAAVLFLWLFAGAAAIASLVVLALVLLALFRARARGDAEEGSTEIAVAFGVLAGVAGILAARPVLESAGAPAAAAVLVVVAFAVLIAVRVARGVAFTVLAASGRLFVTRPKRTFLAWALAGGTLVLVGASALFFRVPAVGDAPLVVAANARRVVVVGVDGWTESLPGEGVARATYGKEARDPAAFWTTVATGESVRRHGIGSLDLVRIAGVRALVRPLAGAGWYLRDILPALHLARRESVTAAARRVPALWEVASRGGILALTVNWWTTYPAEESGGTILGNHLFFAARAGSPLAGEGWPPEAAARAARLAPRLVPEPGSLERLVADARGLDDFALAAFRDAWRRESPRLALVYLPGPDILSSALADPVRGAADRVALAAALTEETAKLRAFLLDPELAPAPDLLVFVLDAGRREGGGVVRLSGPLARAGAEATVAPADLAPTVLSVLGVPASREIVGRVRSELLVPGAVDGETVASWGRRRAGTRPPVDPKEYVENLRSLGYLR
jgi:hypothetical protein